MPYSHCFCWLSLSLCGCFVAKLEPAVSVSSSVQAPASAAQQPQCSLQVPQPSSLPLGLLAGFCTRVACWSVRAQNPSNFSPFPFSAVSPAFVLGYDQYRKLTGYDLLIIILVVISRKFCLVVWILDEKKIKLRGNNAFFQYLAWMEPHLKNGLKVTSVNSL